MKSVVLQTASGEHLGFMLCAIAEGEVAGTCVFIALPKRPELFESEPFQRIVRWRDAGESQVVIEQPSPLRLRVQSPNVEGELLIEGERDSLTWTDTASSRTAVQGRARPPR